MKCPCGCETVFSKATNMCAHCRMGKPCPNMNADRIVRHIPAGYRWATAEESENWEMHRDRMVQVRVGGTDDNPQTDLAIKVQP